MTKFSAKNGDIGYRVMLSEIPAKYWQKHDRAWIMLLAKSTPPNSKEHAAQAGGLLRDEQDYHSGVYCWIPIEYFEESDWGEYSL